MFIDQMYLQMGLTRKCLMTKYTFKIFLPTTFIFHVVIDTIFLFIFTSTLIWAVKIWISTLWCSMLMRWQNQHFWNNAQNGYHQIWNYLFKKIMNSLILSWIYVHAILSFIYATNSPKIIDDFKCTFWPIGNDIE